MVERGMVERRMVERRMRERDELFAPAGGEQQNP